MNVSCPECRSVFRVDPAKIPAIGLRARCSVCGGVIILGAGSSIEEEFAPVAVASAALLVQTAPSAESAFEPVAVAARVPTPARESVAAAAPAPPPPRPPTPRRPLTPPRPAPTVARPASAPPVRPPAFAPRVPPAGSPTVRQTASATMGAATPARPAASPMPAGFPPRPVAPPVPPGPRAGGAPPPRPASPTPSRLPINPFLANDPNAKARRLSRALISDLVTYFPQRREEGLRQGTLRELFRDEIKKSYEEYVEQVGKDFADSTTHFQDALNEILAGGQKIF